MAAKRRHEKTTGRIINERKKELASIKNLMDRNSPKARVEIIKYMEKYPDDIYGVYYYGRIAQQYGDFVTAKEAYTEVAESGSKIFCSGLVGLGELARLTGDRAGAKKYYREAAEKSYQDETYAITTLAKLERLDKNFQGALDALNIPKNGSLPISIEKAHVLGIMGKDQEALNILISLVPENKKQERAIAHQIAMIYYANNDLVTAGKYFEKARSYNIKDTEHYKLLMNEARMHYSAKEYQEAANCCQEVLDNEEYQNGNVNMFLGTIKKAQHDYYAAMTNYELAIKRTKTNDGDDIASRAHFSIGLLKYQSGDFAAAQEYIEKSLSLDNDQEETLLNLLFIINYRQQNYQKAQELLAKMKEQTQDLVTIQHLHFFELHLAKAIGTELPPREGEASYRNKQIIEYSKAEAVEFIRNEHQFTDNKIRFSQQINMEDLYDEVVLQLNPNTILYDDIMDKYLIDYPNVGYDESGTIYDKIYIVTLPGTTNILTMAPTTGEDYVLAKDLAELLTPQKTENKQISKFNSRFAKYNQTKK